MATIDYVFPTLIYSNNVPNFQEENAYLKNMALELKKKFKSYNETSKWNCDTFNTLGIYDDWQKDDIIQQLIRITGNNLLDFAEYYGIKNVRLSCKEFWFNISSPGNYQEFHQHGGHHFSLTYYVQAPKNCGNIIFKSLESYTDMFPLPIEQENRNSVKIHSYEPEESKFLIFRSNLPHMVEKNLSDEDRISIAMNFRFEK